MYFNELECESAQMSEHRGLWNASTALYCAHYIRHVQG